MDFFISLAMAQDGGEPSVLASFIPLILIVVIFYFLLIRPQMKRSKQHRELVAGLKVGDEVVTAGGLLGRVGEVGDSFLTVEIADKVIVRIQKHSIAQVVPKGTIEAIGA